MTRLFVVCFTALSLALFACGGDGGGNKVDATVQPEAGGDLVGLGQKCGTGLPACPANAPDCVGLVMNGGTYCTPRCLEGGAGMSDAQAQLPLNAITPPPNTGTCTAAFTGTVGGPTCALILALQPPDNPVQANKAYTGIRLGCLLACSAGACPAGFTCMTPPGFCFPNP
jgi:hypothetical protein